jgi:hypothetical protein
MVTGHCSSTNLKDSQPTDRDVARAYCWVCALVGCGDDYQTVTATRRHQYSNLGQIPVCDDHGFDMCQCCMADDWQNGQRPVKRGINLVNMKESATFGIRGQICQTCRIDAIYQDGSVSPIDWDEASAAYDYVVHGVGTVEEALEALAIADWLNENQHFLEVREEMTTRSGWMPWEVVEAKAKSGGKMSASREWTDRDGYSHKVSAIPNVRNFYPLHTCADQLKQS